MFNITRNLQRPLLAVYSIRVVRFPPILIVFLTGIVIYITRAPCIGGGRAGGGWGGWRPKKIKKLNRFVGCPFAKMEKAKTRRKHDRRNGHFTDGGHAD